MPYILVLAMVHNRKRIKEVKDMGKKKGALFLFASTGLIVLCASAGLYLNMEKTRQKETSIQIQRKVDVDFEEDFQDAEVSEVDSQESDMQETTFQEGIPAKVFQKKEGINLPEDAKIVSQREDTYKIEWDQCSIEYWQDESLALEKEEDLGLQNLLPLLKEVIKQYSDQTMGDCKIWLSMREAEPGDTNCYEVEIFTGSCYYRMNVDSVTGEVLYYDYSNDNWGEFLGEYISEDDMVDLYYGEYEYELPREEKKEFDALIASFVTDVLNYGNVEKIYGQNADFQYYAGDGGSDFYRACYCAICKTDTGSMIDVTIDIEEKAVTNFSVEMRYTAEE